MDFKEITDIIKNNGSFVITSHVNPDGDAIGSELALYKYLKKIGKSVDVINHSVTPDNLLFLDEDRIVKKFDADEHSALLTNADVIFVLDLNQPNRLVSMEKSFTESKGYKICIDHHTDPAKFVDRLFVSSDFSATGEMIFDMIEQTGLAEMDYGIALEIYTAIMTDTGGFRYDRTNPKVHRIAARLLELGVKSDYVADQVFDQSNVSRIKLLGESISSMKLSESGQVAYQVITQELLKKTGANESEVDGFVNYCLSIAGVQIGLLFFELKDGIKISFRSKGKTPVNKLAAEFGGGGHVNAAGTRLFGGQLNDYIEKVLSASQKYLSIEEEK